MIYGILVFVHVVICFFLMIVVLLQSGSAADLAGAFGGAGSQTAFGPRGPASFLSKATTWCAVMFMLTSLLLVSRANFLAGMGGGGNSILQRFSKSAPAKPAPAKPPLQLPPPTNPQNPQH